MSNLDAQLAAARQSLLDLTMRNPLLNYRQRKARTLRIVDEVPGALFDILVLRERKMEFLARPDPDEPQRPQPTGADPGTPESTVPTTGKDAVDSAAGMSGDPAAVASAPDEPAPSAATPAPAAGSAHRHPMSAPGVRAPAGGPSDGWKAYPRARPAATPAASTVSTATPQASAASPDVPAAGGSPAAPAASAAPAVTDAAAPTTTATTVAPAAPATPAAVPDDEDDPAAAEAALAADSAAAADAEPSADLSSAEHSILWRPPEPDAELSPRHTDRYLQTELTPAELQKRLFYVHQQARTVLEEQGYTIHYVALGFLEWTETPDAVDVRRAPLILVPVELMRPRVAKAFKVTWTGDDVLTNISLREKLAEQGVTLPEFEMPDDNRGIDDYFQAVTDAVARHPRWRVTADVCLDFFSFTKFVMYKDLDPDAWPADLTPAAHPLVRMILDPDPDAPPPAPGFSEDAVDDKLDFRELFYVMDADPSQIAVTEEVKRGRNLVVEGPPGTGKSQTITNIIAELMAAGRSVLFVSEKMAALEVVKARLDAAGVGDYCLELHSRKTRKKAVLDDLERTLQLRSPKRVDLDDEFARLEQLKSELNDYARALGESFGGIKRSPFQLLGQAERCARHFEDCARPRPRLELGDDADCRPADYQQAVARVQELGDAYVLVRPVREHPWFGTDPEAMLPSDQDDIGGVVRSCHQALATLSDTAARLARMTGIHDPTCPAEVKPALTAAGHVGIAPRVDEALLRNGAWDRRAPEALELIDKLTTLRSVRDALRERLTEAALEREIAGVLHDYKMESAKLLRFLSSRYRYLRREIDGLYRARPPRAIDVRIRDLEQLAELHELREELRAAAEAGRALFGDEWHGPDTDPAKLRAFANWIVGFRQRLRDGVITDAAVARITAGVEQSEVDAAVEATRAAAETLSARHNELTRRIKLRHAAAFGVEAERVPFGELGRRLERMAEALDALHVWTQFMARCRACAETVSAPTVDLVADQDPEPADLVPAFEAAFADAVLRRAFLKRPVLGEFVGELHDGKRRRFAELDRRLIALNRERLAYRLHDRRPTIQPGAPVGSEAGILQGEFNRKRRHMPIRKLMARAGRLIQKIKPCFMMSPLSIAKFLDPTTARFDVIVFDEASQVRPEDALGSLLRGEQVVVMGDTRQLPPTSFFDHLVDTEPLPDDTASVAEVESILHQCKRSLPTKHLRWHYRSRHESLIAVSNQEFYDNKLYIYPSAVDRDGFLGLHLRHLAEAPYDRGRSGVNREEARAVVQAAMEHYRRHPTRSLGVGAFNIRQQQAILEEVELLLRRHPEMEHYFSSERPEHFFVKNLETIQGDERDVIFISIGFGFDDDGRLSRNFGPVNQQGGERRLNVLITRARESCVVFSNFRADDLAVEPAHPFGLRALKVFLDYAENRRLQSILASGEDFGSPFERSVYDFLTAEGFEVRKQVGCASYRVDLAVIDPQRPGRFLLGVECDGARYHSAPVARDRDRLRQQVLERLGWRLHRVWSTDWYRNRAACREALLRRIEEVRGEQAAAEAATERAAREEAAKAEAARARSEAARTAAGRAAQAAAGGAGAGATVAGPTAKPGGRRPASPGAGEAGAVASENGVGAGTVESGDAAAGPDDVAAALGVEEYAVCPPPAGFEPLHDLHEVPAGLLADLIGEIVRVEGPVHEEEVIRRLRGWWDVGRAGSRIRESVDAGIDAAVGAGRLLQDSHEFLWSVPRPPVQVRRRTGDPPAKIELICDEEVAEAVKLVLQAHHATMPDELARHGVRLLGMRAVSASAAARVQGIIRGLLIRGTCERLLNGMIALKGAGH